MDLQRRCWSFTNSKGGCDLWKHWVKVVLDVLLWKLLLPPQKGLLHHLHPNRVSRMKQPPMRLPPLSVVVYWQMKLQNDWLNRQCSISVPFHWSLPIDQPLLGRHITNWFWIQEHNNSAQFQHHLLIFKFYKVLLNNNLLIPNVQKQQFRNNSSMWEWRSTIINWNIFLIWSLWKVTVIKSYFDFNCYD